MLIFSAADFFPLDLKTPLNINVTIVTFMLRARVWGIFHFRML